MRLSLVAIGLALTLTMSFSWVKPACAEGPEVPATPYDAELYVLGYDVFLANGNPRDAFSLAEKAVAARPDDPEWRRRAARSGEWSGSFVRALEHWYFLATVLSDQDAQQQALRLARELRDYQKLQHLLEPGLASGDVKVLQEYVSASELLGVPEDAIKALEPERRGPNGKYALEQLARIYDAVGRPEDAIAALLELVASHNGATASILLKAASLAYGRGDLLSSYTIMNLGRKKIAPSEHEYWALLGDLDWAMQNMKGATQDARVMIGEGNGRVVDYQRLIAANRDKDNVAVYDLALEGWRHFGTPSFFFTLLESAISLNRYAEMATLLREAVAKGALKPYEGYSYHWALLSRIYQGIGDYSESIRCYREAMKRSSDNGALRAGYVWLLLDLDRRKELQDILQGWNGREKYMPELNDPFGAAYSFLGYNYRALQFFQARYLDKRNDPAWLVTYADVLEQTGQPEIAYQERLRALRLVRKRMTDGIPSIEEERKELERNYVRLAMRIEPGDSLNSMMQGIIRGKQDDVSRELVAAWALSTERNDFARIWFVHAFAKSVRTPQWIELTLAMEENDRPRIAKILGNDPERLPYRDAIEALQRTGSISGAETHAFEHFQINGEDHLLDRQVRELFDSHRGSFSYGLGLMDLGGIGFLEQRISLVHPLTPSLALRADAGNTDIRHLKSGIIANYVSSAQSARVGLGLRHEYGVWEATAGFYDGLSRHAVATLVGDWRLNNRQTLDFSLLWGATASESVPLMVGGQKDEFSVGLLNTLTPRDSLMGRLSGRSLQDQDGHELGQGISIESELTHRLLLEWPDTNLRFFSGYHHYERTGVPTGKALALIPPARIADESFFVPLSFFQTGVGINAGQDGRKSYLRRWSPFGSLDLIWNSESGMGYHYELGMAGPVLGLDKLECDVSQESGAFGYSDINTRFDFQYRYFF